MDIFFYCLYVKGYKTADIKEICVLLTEMSLMNRIFALVTSPASILILVSFQGFANLPFLFWFSWFIGYFPFSVFFPFLLYFASSVFASAAFYSHGWLIPSYFRIRLRIWSSTGIGSQKPRFFVMLPSLLLWNWV